MKLFLRGKLPVLKRYLLHFGLIRLQKVIQGELWIDNPLCRMQLLFKTGSMYD